MRLTNKARTCQGCGSPDLTKLSSPRWDLEIYDCNKCGHRSFYLRDEENWKVG